MSGKYLKNCLVCSCEFEATHLNCKKCIPCKSRLFCSECDKETHKSFSHGRIKCLECRVNETHEKYTEENSYEWIECRFCGYRAEDLGGHLRAAHNTNADEYGISKSQRQRDRVKGENNPAYQHGGKLSPWSKKSLYHTEEQIEQSRKLAKENMLANPESGPNTLNVEYYIAKGMSLEDAKKALSERQSTFSLEKCIEKHGEVEGTKIWQARQDKWQATLDLKTDDEKAEINLKKIWKGGEVSKVETEFAEKLKAKVDITRQFIIRNNIHHFVCDVLFGKKIIEFNGDYWHANPKKYQKDDLLYNGKSAKSIWKKDKYKLDYLKSLGYEVMTVWETEYKKDKTGTISECILFLTGEHENSLTQFM